MFGDILKELTNETTAGEILAVISSPEMVARVRHDALAEGVTAGAFVAARVRHILDHAGEETWLDLLGRMSGSPRPGVAALEAMLDQAFPDEAAGPCCSHAP
ncbi:MAG TPA: hypothetical protein VGV37_21615 [Aliidongia sp.]|uniref:hypothetical protein n=1 Tax=Aliidongia sp. TaxID=1914230 RepID=UPI002DDD94E8|nr:hypothetical protein [Aliidongia sp.]HEV2677140.1 hypothetical protein [Aliidongia sp.]